jgi:hypothetical protein
MAWLGLVKEVIETFYYISGIILVAGVVIGLKQITLVKEQLSLVKSEAELVKKDFNIRNKRASIEKGIEYLNWFATDFIPQSNDYNRSLSGKEIKNYQGMNIRKKGFVFDNEVSRGDNLVVISIDEKVNAGALNLMNQLEFFSAALTSGLADEELVFNPLALVFCEFIERHYEVYCDIRNDGKDTMYSHTIELYDIWKQRLESIELDKKQKEIDYQKSKIKPLSIKYLGNE